MKGLDRGPKIEFSKLKSGDVRLPGPLRDLWSELRTQRLLPVVAILVVGLIAIPILLGGSSKPKTHGNVGAIATAPGGSKSSDLVVSKFTPGLRDYRRRHEDRKPTDPFAEPHRGNSREGSSKSATGAAATGPVLLEPTPEEGSGGTGGAGSGAEESPVSPPSEENPGGAPKERPTEEVKPEADEPVTLDVRVTTIHLDGKSSETTRHDVSPSTALPGEEVPALTYVGPGDDGRAALMTVSSEVTALLGKSPCVVKGEPCKKLSLELGKPETLVYGPLGWTYRIELRRIGDLTAAKGGEDKDSGSSNTQRAVGPSRIALG